MGVCCDINRLGDMVELDGLLINRLGAREIKREYYKYYCIG